MLDWLQRKILRRSKHLGEHIDGLEVRQWAMKRKLNCMGGKDTEILEGLFSAISKPICATKRAPEPAALAAGLKFELKADES